MAVSVVGRFPPPLDGQSIATRRLASLLSEQVKVETFDLNPGGEAFVQSRVRFRPGAALHFARTGRRLRRWLAERTEAPVLWTGTSASPLGHFRDALTIAPALARAERAYGVVHHGGFADLFASSLTRGSARRLVSGLAGVVFLSETLAERAAPWVPREKRLVVPNTIDDALIPSAAELEAKRAEHEARDTLQILFFSHMIPSKGYLDVVRALGILRERGVDARADFVGRWDSEAGREAFDRAVREAGVEAHVTHHGGVSDRETARAHYLGADVFCLPTTYPTEAQPLTIIEALAAGCPVAVTPHASLPEMVDEGRSGAFAPAHDPAALADAIERLAADWPARSRDARARFEAAFAPDVVRARWLSLLGLGT